MGNCFKKNEIHEGDFSFVKDPSFRRALIYDYAKCLKILPENKGKFVDGHRPSFDQEKPTLWDTPPVDEWKKIQNEVYPLHSETSYRKSMRILSFIKFHGWRHFIKNRSRFDI
jgi:hypothetical protein